MYLALWHAICYFCFSFVEAFYVPNINFIHSFHHRWHSSQPDQDWSLCFFTLVEWCTCRIINLIFFCQTVKMLLLSRQTFNKATTTTVTGLATCMFLTGWMTELTPVAKKGRLSPSSFFPLQTGEKRVNLYELTSSGQKFVLKDHTIHGQCAVGMSGPICLL